MSLKREEKDKIKEFLLKTISIGENPYKAMENNFYGGKNVLFFIWKFSNDRV